jgi:nitrate reductase gamma subunit
MVVSLNIPVYYKGKIMLNLSIRFGKRFALLLPGIIIAYFSVRDIFPYFDNRLPLGIAIFVTYVLAAYVLIPAIIRLVRVVVPADHLPLYCVTPDGFASDPINIGIIGTREQLVTAMEQIGWHEAAAHNVRNTLREALSTVYGWSYPNAPMSHLYLFGRHQDIGFSIPIEDQQGARHHVRFWGATYEESQRLSARSIHWHNRQAHVRADRLLWVGSASRDVGIAYIRHNFQLTHMIDPDTDSERRLIADQLHQANLATGGQTIKLGAPYRLKNRALRGYLQSDGQMRVLKLKTPT